MNYLFCSVGRRVQLLNYFRQSLDHGDKIIATDNSKYAPALQVADKRYLVPKVTDTNYIDILIDICIDEEIDAVFTLIDPEIMILAENRAHFSDIGVVVFVPEFETAKLFFDKYKMYQFLVKNGIDTPLTFDNISDFELAQEAGEVKFPVFVKPRTGSGSVGAVKVKEENELKLLFNNDSTLIIQEFMDCDDIDVDVYVDIFSHKAISAFAKNKIETKIGGANKTISFIDNSLFELIQRIVKKFIFRGTIDIDFFYRNGKYYLSEINPRFGGGYIHAYSAGVDFIKLIQNNLHGLSNKPSFGDYPENHVMMMYDSAVFQQEDKLFDIDASNDM